MQRRTRRLATTIGVTATALLTASGLALAASPPGKKKAGGMMSASTGAKIAVLSPKPGETITGNAIPFQIAIAHFKVDCAYAGTADRPGIGHYHVHLDGGLVDMFCGPKGSVSLANVPAGKHTLEYVAAENSHMEDMHSAATVSFVYKPSAPLAVEPRSFAGAPSIAIVSPKNGAAVHGGFDLVVAVKNFVPSCQLYGKPDLAGYGHWHAFVDTTHGGPMGMGTMLGMSCARSFHVSLAGVKPGPHTFFAQLEDNLHMPSIKGAGATASVSLTVK